jgi:SOS-response transcriptional repressor LexA
MGETDIRLSDGTIWQFRFMRAFCNVARPAGTQRNELPDLLRKWFGPRAGQPGTAFEVWFHVEPDGFWVEPTQTVRTLAVLPGRMIAYPDLRAAAGHLLVPAQTDRTEFATLPVGAATPDEFAVRVAGTSMAGGEHPIHDGDWAIMRLCRAEAPSALENRVVLVQVRGEQAAAGYQIKRLRRQDGQWLLTSDNPSGPTFRAGDDMVPIARFERAIDPAQLAPVPGVSLAGSELAAAFHLTELEPRSGRYEGHLFLFLTAPGPLREPDRVADASTAPSPGETAFVLARTDAGYRYLGVGRQTETAGYWAIDAGGTRRA